MVISTQRRWSLAARIAIELANSGFLVAVVSPRGSFVRKTQVFDAHYGYHSWTRVRSVERAIKSWHPDFLICSDDQAIADMHALYVRASKSEDEAAKAVVDLITTSLFDPAVFSIAQKKSLFIDYAKSLGLRCPRTTLVPDARILASELRAATYPILVKADGSYGGTGVRKATSADEVRSSFFKLSTFGNHPNAIKRALSEFLPWQLLSWARQRRTVCLQEYIVGRPANRAVVCYMGEVLAGISVKAVETFGEFGPATIIEVIDQPEMAAAAALIVRKLKLSGFHGFDFVLDPSNQAWLIELNPRVTQISHLGAAAGLSLSVAFFSKIGDAEPKPQLAWSAEKIIVLFPLEMRRSNRSKYMFPHYHDVPWDQPELVYACMKWALQKGPVAWMWRRLKLLGRNNNSATLEA